MESINKRSLKVSDSSGSKFIRIGRSINGDMHKINWGASPHIDESINRKYLSVAEANKSKVYNYTREYTVLNKHSVDKV